MLITAATAPLIAANLNAIANAIHHDNAKWWMDLHQPGVRIDRNFGELIALAHSELSEALEGHRKNLMDDKLPHRKMAEVELADAVIRILDTAAGLGYDIGGALTEKLLYNQTRHDHSVEGRLAEGGKAY